ncbi:hypothetical protein ADUPG1_010645 [Aduncisulcus paluster]|uniref:FPL domain-containing protein n=1 Tax=Aduncisulcus paluster TaxID=2918883 RepID=A0ABQ5JSS5_9EUKA|nr:hypothetical protein ADUPG1_010645 [Aduncisulcus paluster]
MEDLIPFVYLDILSPIEERNEFFPSYSQNLANILFRYYDFDLAEPPSLISLLEIIKTEASIYTTDFDLSIISKSADEDLFQYLDDITRIKGLPHALIFVKVLMSHPKPDEIAKSLILSFIVESILIPSLNNIKNVILEPSLKLYDFLSNPSIIPESIASLISAQGIREEELSFKKMISYEEHIFFALNDLCTLFCSLFHYVVGTKPFLSVENFETFRHSTIGKRIHEIILDMNLLPSLAALSRSVLSSSRLHLPFFALVRQCIALCVGPTAQVASMIKKRSNSSTLFHSPPSHSTDETSTDDPTEISSTAGSSPKDHPLLPPPCLSLHTRYLTSQSFSNTHAKILAFQHPPPPPPLLPPHTSSSLLFTSLSSFHHSHNLPYPLCLSPCLTLLEPISPGHPIPTLPFLAGCLHGALEEYMYVSGKWEGGVDTTCIADIIGEREMRQLLLAEEKRDEERRRIEHERMKDGPDPDDGTYHEDKMVSSDFSRFIPSAMSLSGPVTVNNVAIQPFFALNKAIPQKNRDKKIKGSLEYFMKCIKHYLSLYPDNNNNNNRSQVEDEEKGGSKTFDPIDCKEDTPVSSSSTASLLWAEGRKEVVSEEKSDISEQNIELPLPTSTHWCRSIASSFPIDTVCSQLSGGIGIDFLRYCSSNDEILDSSNPSTEPLSHLPVPRNRWGNNEMNLYERMYQLFLPHVKALLYSLCVLIQTATQHSTIHSDCESECERVRGRWTMIMILDKQHSQDKPYYIPSSLLTPLFTAHSRATTSFIVDSCVRNSVQTLVLLLEGARRNHHLQFSFIADFLAKLGAFKLLGSYLNSDLEKLLTSGVGSEETNDQERISMWHLKHFSEFFGGVMADERCVIIDDIAKQVIISAPATHIHARRVLIACVCVRGLCLIASDCCDRARSLGSTKLVALLKRVVAVKCPHLLALCSQTYVHAMPFLYSEWRKRNRFVFDLVSHCQHYIGAPQLTACLSDPVTLAKEHGEYVWRVEVVNVFHRYNYNVSILSSNARGIFASPVIMKDEEEEVLELDGKVIAWPFIERHIVSLYPIGVSLLDFKSNWERYGQQLDSYLWRIGGEEEKEELRRRQIMLSGISGADHEISGIIKEHIGGTTIEDEIISLFVEMKTELDL